MGPAAANAPGNRLIYLRFLKLPLLADASVAFYIPRAQATHRRRNEE
jgi:hypothetical protein